MTYNLILLGSGFLIGIIAYLLGYRIGIKHGEENLQFWRKEATSMFEYITNLDHEDPYISEILKDLRQEFKDEKHYNRGL